MDSCDALALSRLVPRADPFLQCGLLSGVHTTGIIVIGG